MGCMYLKTLVLGVVDMKTKVLAWGAMERVPSAPRAVPPPPSFAVLCFHSDCREGPARSLDLKNLDPKVWPTEERVNGTPEQIAGRTKALRWGALCIQW
jgi:hypothetical protein